MSFLLDLLKKSSSNVYDPSKNTVSIAELYLDSITDVKIDYPEVTKTIMGTSGVYTTPVRVNPKCAIVTISLLPTANCIDQLNQLLSATLSNNWVFETHIKKNAKTVLQGSSWFQSPISHPINERGDDVTYTVCVNMSTSPTAPDTNIETIIDPFNDNTASSPPTV